MIINGKEYNRQNLGKIFDYAMLSPDVTREQVENHLKLAVKYNVSGVHCNPYWIPLVKERLMDTDIETGICPSFPVGCASTKMKVYQVEEYCKFLEGRPACVDMVVNIGLLRGGELKEFTNDISEVCKVAHHYGYDMKAILETTFLNDQQIADGAKCAAEAGVDFVKAASGRSGVADLHAMHIMKANVPSNIKLKFSAMGTVNLTEQTIMGLTIGCSMFGTGYAHKIIEELETYYKDLVITTK